MITTVALPPMTNMALQLLVNPPKMAPDRWAWMVAQLTKG